MNKFIAFIALLVAATVSVFADERVDNDNLPAENGQKVKTSAKHYVEYRIAPLFVLRNSGAANYSRLTTGVSYGVIDNGFAFKLTGDLAPAGTTNAKNHPEVPGIGHPDDFVFLMLSASFGYRFYTPIEHFYVTPFLGYVYSVGVKVTSDIPGGIQLSLALTYRLSSHFGIGITPTLDDFQGRNIDITDISFPFCAKYYF